MLRRAKQAKRQIIESLNKRILGEQDNELDSWQYMPKTWSKEYEPFHYKENSERLGGSLDWEDHGEWEMDENIQRWEEEGRLYSTPLVDYTFGVYVLKGDNEVIDYVLNKFGN